MTQGRSEPMSDELWLGLGLGLSAQRQAVGSTSVTLYLNTASSPELLSHTSRRKGKFKFSLATSKPVPMHHGTVLAARRTETKEEESVRRTSYILGFPHLREYGI